MTKRRKRILYASIMLLIMACLLCLDRRRNRGLSQNSGNFGFDPLPVQPVAAIKRDAAGNTASDRAMDPGNTWRQPIEFYGIVVEHNGLPIASADIYIVSTDLSPKGNTSWRMKSKGDGTFDLTGATGSGISVRVSKPGYYSTGSSGGDFGYGETTNPRFHRANRDNRVRCELRKKVDRIETILINVEFGMQKPDRTIHFNPISRSMLDPEGFTFQVLSGEHTVRMTCIGGGLVPTVEELPFEAPVDGYQDSITATMPTDNSRVRYVSGKAYFRLMAPKTYGVVTWQVDLSEIEYKDPFMRAGFCINTNGTRNLEHDPIDQPLYLHAKDFDPKQ